MNDKSLNLFVIFCSFILFEKYLIVKNNLNLLKKKRSNVEDLMINNKKKVLYLVNLLE